MAFVTPKFRGPDGILREELIYTTTIVNKFFTGTVDPLTVDVQVSIREDPFSSNPDFIVFSGNNFTIPNPQVFPDGLSLTAGENTIKVRAISNIGTVSDPAITVVSLIQDSDIAIIPVPPTNVTIEKFDKSVIVRVEGLDDNQVTGFNFYASEFAGGGATGYSRINVLEVADFTQEEEVEVISTLSVDGQIAKNADGTPVADPLFLKIYGAQVIGPDLVTRLEDVELEPRLAAEITIQEQDNLIRTEYNTLREIPEFVERTRTTTTIESVRDIPIFSFQHDRLANASSNPATVPLGKFAGLDPQTPIFYVVTALYFDSLNQVELESSFSAEVTGHPLTVTARIGTFPQVTRSQLSTDVIQAIQAVRPQVALQAGSITRDVVIDPATSEFVRLRFILEILNQFQSFPLLLQVDGIASDGGSLPVAQSPRKLALKRAFLLTSNLDTQAIVDAAFERLAANFQETRRPGERSRGEVTLFTQSRPTSTLPFPAGTIASSGAVRFQTTVDASIPIERLASFFNPISGRFSVTVPVQAIEVGSIGNLGTGQIRTLEGNFPGVSVINAADTFGGKNQDTNLELATRAQNRLASVDSGREQGYLQTAAGVPGVREAFVVGPGDDLMQRDFFPELNRHLGGKVDIYIKGRNDAVVTDNFAFTFEIAENIQFTILGDPKNLEFKAQDPDLNALNPIIEMLEDPAIGFEFRNASTGEVFDLKDVTITSFNTIELSKEISQPNVDLTDVVFGDYRFRTGEKFVFLRQPVTSLTRVTGSISGVLPDESFTLVRTSSPLQEGSSIKAEDFLQIVGTTTSLGNSIPSGELIDIESESHVLIGESTDFLNNLGANSLTIEVFNFDRTVKFRGPNDSSGSSDFLIELGNQTEPVGIRRSSTTNIETGQQVLVDYRHEENFSVEYVINNIPAIVQSDLERNRHTTADVLAKQTVLVPINITATILIESTASKAAVDSTVRADIALFLDGLKFGISVHQSDIIGIMELVDGVSHIVTPLTQLVRSGGAPILRENLITSQNGDIQYIAGDPIDPISTSTVSVFLLNEPLTAATDNGGGPLNEFRAVYEDDIELNLQVVRPETMGSAVGNAFIIGNDGLSIPEFSDDDTLREQNPLATDLELEQIRKDLTANRVMVSVSVDDSPLNHIYSVTYIASDENEGVRDIEPGPLEELTVGTLVFIYEEVRVAQR